MRSISFDCDRFVRSMSKCTFGLRGSVATNKTILPSWENSITCCKYLMRIRTISGTMPFRGQRTESTITSYGNADVFRLSLISLARRLFVDIVVVVRSVIRILRLRCGKIIRLEHFIYHMTDIRFHHERNHTFLLPCRQGRAWQCSVRRRVTQQHYRVQVIYIARTVFCLSAS